MAWIESHVDLEEHPKLHFLCSKTGWDKSQAIGKLHQLWYWVLKYAEDGDLSKYDFSQFLVRLDDKKDPKNLYNILQECNFIEKSGLIHDWLDYAGRYLTGKYRTSKPLKLKEIYKKHKTVFSQTKDCRKTDNQPTLPTIPNLPTPVSEEDGDLFSLFWTKYPFRDGKKLNKQGAKKIFEELSKLDQMGAARAAQNFAESQQVKKGYGIKDPERFLRCGRKNEKTEPWRDWLEPETLKEPDFPGKHYVT